MTVVTKDPFTYEYARRKGIDVHTPEQALNSKEREIHLAIVNAMPPGAVKQTPAQISVAIANAAGSRQVVIHNFYVDGVDYGEHSEYIEKHYHSLDELSSIKPDAMAFTGAGPDDFENLKSAVKKAMDYDVTSRLFLCMGFHAVSDQKYGIQRKPFNADNTKLHGVFAHEATSIKHAVTEGLGVIHSSHSRFYDVNWGDLIDKNLRVLMYGADSGVLAACSEDGRDIMLQGHIEYTKPILLREFWRDTVQTRYKHINDQNDNTPYPPYPQNYLNQHGKTVMDSFCNKLRNGDFDHEIVETNGAFKLPAAIEKQVMQRTDDTHSSVSNHIFANWINAVFEATGFERGEAIMDGVDPQNPFGMDKSELVFEGRVNGLLQFNSKGDVIECRVPADEILYCPLYNKNDL